MAKKTIAVHDGLFHADELVAISLWLIAHPGEVFQVIRTRDVETINSADVVIDVGGTFNAETLRFDHHMRECPVHRGTTVKYAACGMVWDYVRSEISHLYFGGLNVTPFLEFQDRVSSQLILGVDACDNGQATNNNEVHQFSLSEMIKVMNQNNIYSAEQNVIFNRLIDITKEWVDKFLKNTAQAVRDKYTILEAANAAKDGILILPKFCPVWKEICLSEQLPIKLCLVAAGNDGEYSITSALKESGSMEPICPAPAALRGTMAGDGKKLAECPIVFIHKAGFTGKVKANNLDEALEACKAWING